MDILIVQNGFTAASRFHTGSRKVVGQMKSDITFQNTSNSYNSREIMIFVQNQFGGLYLRSSCAQFYSLSDRLSRSAKVISNGCLQFPTESLKLL